MKKTALSLTIATLLAQPLSFLANPATSVPMPTTSPEIKIKFDKGPNDSNIVLTIEVSGSNEKDIAKIVDLITSVIDQMDASTSTQLSWTAQNPTAALVITGVVSAGLTAAIAAAVVHMRSE